MFVLVDYIAGGNLFNSIHENAPLILLKHTKWILMCEVEQG